MCPLFGGSTAFFTKRQDLAIKQAPESCSDEISTADSQLCVITVLASAAAACLLYIRVVTIAQNLLRAYRYRWPDFSPRTFLVVHIPNT